MFASLARACAHAVGAEPARVDVVVRVGRVVHRGLAAHALLVDVLLVGRAHLRVLHLLLHHLVDLLVAALDVLVHLAHLLLDHRVEVLRERGSGERKRSGGERFEAGGSAWRSSRRQVPTT
jgi:hypothetical protein